MDPDVQSKKATGSLRIWGAPTGWITICEQGLAGGDVWGHLGQLHVISRSFTTIDKKTSMVQLLQQTLPARGYLS